MSSLKSWNLDEIIGAISEYMNKDQVKLVKRAYEYASKAHEGQYRQSGELYITHPTEVAGILAGLNMDAETISAGFLHDVVEDTDSTLEDIQSEFGNDVALIVDGVTKLGKIKYKSSVEQLAENHRKLLLAMCKDIRVMIVKLADRLHNMHTLDSVPEEKKRRIAKETLEIYAPIANRLGIGTIKWELEDLSLRYINPQQYYRVVNLMNSKRQERVIYVQEAIDEIKKATSSLGIKGEIYGRPKHLYSVYKKMHDQHKQFSQVYDLFAVRVIVDSVKDCYAVLGAVHTKWRPMPGRFKDYIAMPKANMYQSLHTTVIGPEGKLLEIQIRTKQMHQIAEYGVAAHWAYKEGIDSQEEVQRENIQLNWFKKIIEIQEESEDASDFMDSVKVDLFGDNVYAFTPSGDVLELPKGSCPIDMAYSIHTDVGNKTTGAKVNGKIVPLDYRISNGDIVDIITSNKSTGPGKNWTEFVKTKRARHKIKQFFKQRDRDKNVIAGKEIIEKAIKDEGYNPTDVLTNDNIDRVVSEMKFTSEADLFAALGFGDIQPQGILNRLTNNLRLAAEEEKQLATEKALLENHEKISNDKSDDRTNDGPQDNIIIEGVDNLLVRLSHCCSPIPGDDISGYITKGRGVSIHRSDCPNMLQDINYQNRSINVHWNNNLKNSNTMYDAFLKIDGYNRNGLLNDVLKKLNSISRNLNSVEGKVDHNKMVSISLSIGVRNTAQLNRVIDAIKTLPDVYVVERPFR
ncbi:RelA/SpoT family protein [Lactobacillus sp. S2-2]|uniref:RelA/SpoT family protein n=1 Tax=Lactobacillus sp. S2-2 TaxID=2692917 RepID=UPI001F1CA1BE|nr:bifunctional (p)ppGpp synthetase/guanosine-3',5'-bis(diphosphate) 3'-pyrophosphohydrolase [Lactobacillus sp. S2-2]MCF6514966.1 RelA/SpoT family protein [Lactobacillus sp. S2-2]